MPGKTGPSQSTTSAEPAQITPDRAAVARAQWEKEMPGIELDPMVLLGRLNEASHLVTNAHVAPVLKTIGLKLGEFDVLATLVRSGPPYKLMPTDLYKSTMMSSGGMTARLDRLEKAGHITRCPHPQDRRALMVCLTESGLTLIKSVMPDYIACQKKLVSGLSKTEAEMLTGLLGKLLCTIRED